MPQGRAEGKLIRADLDVHGSQTSLWSSNGDTDQHSSGTKVHLTKGHHPRLKMLNVLPTRTQDMEGKAPDPAIANLCGGGVSISS